MSKDPKASKAQRPISGPHLRAIGKSGSLKVDGLVIWVRILDSRVRYGHYDYLVEPLAGEGQRWVDSVRIKLATLDRLLT